MIGMISNILYPLLNIDVRTLISVLFWGNIISMLLVYSFSISNPFSRDKALSSYYVLAKLFQSPAYFLLFFRGYLPDIFSVHLGNTMLFVGFYWEARSMLAILQNDNGKCHKTVHAISVTSIILFNAAEIIKPDSPPFRVFVSSICVFLTLCIPTIMLLFGRRLSNFKRVVGLFYVLFLSMLLPRAYAAMETHTSLLSNTLIQTMTFLALVLLMIFSLSAYLLLIKESTDKVLRTMATTDSLTGLYNRHTFTLAAGRVLEKHKNTGSVLALIFFDIDDFKKTNDQYGHNFGDMVLNLFADALRRGVRSMDLICRYGGEEFLVLLPRADSAAALQVGLRVQSALCQVLAENELTFECTVSGGIASGLPHEPDTLKTFINQADNALYEAKRKGKNKLIVWDESHNAQKPFRDMR